MKFYSETLDKLFDTEQELLKAEYQFKGEETLRYKSRVEETYRKYLKAQEQAEKRRDEIIAGPKRDWINIKGAYYAQKSKEYLDGLNVRDILSLFNL